MPRPGRKGAEGILVAPVAGFYDLGQLCAGIYGKSVVFFLRLVDEGSW